MCSIGLHMPFWGMPIGGIFMFLLMLALVYFVYKTFTAAGKGAASGCSQADTASSLRILNERLARGEITPEEFERIRNILRS